MSKSNRYIAEGIAQGLADHLDDFRQTVGRVMAYDGDKLTEHKVQGVTDCFAYDGHLTHTSWDGFQAVVDGVVYYVAVTEVGKEDPLEAKSTEKPVGQFGPWGTEGRSGL